MGMPSAVCVIALSRVQVRQVHCIGDIFRIQRHGYCRNYHCGFNGTQNTLKSGETELAPIPDRLVNSDLRRLVAGVPEHCKIHHQQRRGNL